jgi:hypothetical protein
LTNKLECLLLTSFSRLSLIFVDNPMGLPRLSTNHLLVLTSLDQLLFILKILYFSATERATLMRRSNVRSLPLQSDFPGLPYPRVLLSSRLQPCLSVLDKAKSLTMKNDLAYLFIKKVLKDRCSVETHKTKLLNILRICVSSHKTFFSSPLMLQQNKLERFLPERIFSLV